MLLRRDVLDAIVAGEVDMQFRLWRKPTVKPGGRLRTIVGELMILSVDEIDLSDSSSVSEDDARRAGFGSADDVRRSLLPRPVVNSFVPAKAGSAGRGRGRTAQPDETSRPYRVTLRFDGADTRLALREDTSPSAVSAVVDRLDAIDARSARGPWTRRTLRLIADWPGRRAPELAEMEALETAPFKNDVRKLKELGLTVSLSVGYELSPRGRAVLFSLDPSTKPAGRTPRPSRRSLPPK